MLILLAIQTAIFARPQWTHVQRRLTSDLDPTFVDWKTMTDDGTIVNNSLFLGTTSSYRRNCLMAWHAQLTKKELLLISNLMLVISRSGVPPRAATLLSVATLWVCLPIQNASFYFKSRRKCSTMVLWLPHYITDLERSKIKVKKM